VSARAVPAWAVEGVRRRALGEPQPQPWAGSLLILPSAALPRAYLAASHRVAPAAEELSLLRAGAYRDGPVLRAGESLREGRLTPRGPDQAAGTSPGAPSPVRPARWSPAVVEFEVTPAAPSLLVVNDAFAEGWHAAVDGQPGPIFRANRVCRAVPVPAGRHQVRMWFDVPLFRWALQLPRLGLALAFLALVVHMVLQRRRRSE
jgi:hypothetical protein